MAKLTCIAMFVPALVLLSARFLSGAPCSCKGEERIHLTTTSPPEASNEEFKIHVDENGVKYDELVKVDVQKNTETIHVPAYNNMDEGDIIYDFNKNLTMIRFTERESCYLSEINHNIPPPKKLLGVMEKMGSSTEKQEKKTSYTTWTIKGPVTDRLSLSDEMATLCARFPIYRIVQGLDVVSVEKTRQGRQPRRRRRRNSVCGRVCTSVLVYSLQCTPAGCVWKSYWQSSCSTIFC